MFDTETRTLAFEIISTCTAQGLTIGTVESCTGGLIAGALTEIPGASSVVMAGLVTYSNEAKTALAHVPKALIDAHGAVSEEVARAMAEGGRKVLDVDLVCAVTGIAGPGGGSVAKPVGLVHLAVSRGCHATLHRACRYGDIGRDGVRHQTVITALEMLLDMVRV
jgi:nicotinamide-nucleotide amidase